MRALPAALVFTGCSLTTTDAERSTLIPMPPPDAEEAEWMFYGASFSVASTRPAAEVLREPSAHADTPVRITGELTQVCEKMGCWAVLRDEEGRTVRITMKDHAFGIAKDARGKAADVEGQLVAQEVDPDRLAHYEEEGASEHPEAGKDVAWSLVATGVAIAR